MSLEQEILSLESKRFAAMCAEDFPALEKLVHGELVYTHSNALVDSKASWIESMRSGKVRYRSVAPGEQKVRVYGDTAFVTARAVIEAQVDGQPRTLRLRYTDAWIRTPQGWQFVAWQATPIPA
jgi:ketosteroid isomerase-like protein